MTDDYPPPPLTLTRRSSSRGILLENRQQEVPPLMRFWRRCWSPSNSIRSVWTPFRIC